MGTTEVVASDIRMGGGHLFLPTCLPPLLLFQEPGLEKEEEDRQEEEMQSVESNKSRSCHVILSQHQGSICRATSDVKGTSLDCIHSDASFKKQE